MCNTYVTVSVNVAICYYKRFWPIFISGNKDNTYGKYLDIIFTRDQLERGNL